MSIEIVVAFITGVGSILGSTWALRRARREERERCAEEKAELRDAFERGFGMARDA